MSLRVSQNGYSPLLMACCKGHLDVVRWLAEVKGVDYHNDRDKVVTHCGSCAPCVCRPRARRAGCGHAHSHTPKHTQPLGTLSSVSQYGGMLLHCRCQNGYSGLLLACYFGHQNVVKWMVEIGGVDWKRERVRSNNWGCCVFRTHAATHTHTRTHTHNITHTRTTLHTHA